MPPCRCDPLSVGSGGEGEAFPFESKGGEQGYSAVVRELASYQCGPGSNPSVNGRFQKISIPYHRRLLGFPKGRGGSRLWNSEGMGGIYDWKSEGMGEFHRWDFWSRKCRVSSLKTLLLWTFVVRK